MQDVLQKPILTKRDKEVLLSIYYHRCLTTEQVAEIHFRYDPKGTENTQAQVLARRRLRKLFDYVLIDRFFIDAGENNGSSQGHLILDTLGAKVVAGLLNTSVEELEWRYDMNETRLPYLKHMVDINRFYISLLKASRPRGHEASYFRTENHVRHEFKYQDGRVRFNPDAYGQYWMGQEGFDYFLEWDNGTMTASTFQKKHKRYTAFYASDEYLKFYQTFPAILVVTTSMDRAEELRKCISIIDRTDMVWLFTSEDRVERDILGPIWIDKEKKPVSLLD